MLYSPRALDFNAFIQTNLLNLPISSIPASRFSRRPFALRLVYFYFKLASHGYLGSQLETLKKAAPRRLNGPGPGA